MAAIAHRSGLEDGSFLGSIRQQIRLYIQGRESKIGVQVGAACTWSGLCSVLDSVGVSYTPEA